MSHLAATHHLANVVDIGVRVVLRGEVPSVIMRVVEDEVPVGAEPRLGQLEDLEREVAVADGLLCGGEDGLLETVVSVGARRRTRQIS